MLFCPDINEQVNHMATKCPVILEALLLPGYTQKHNLLFSPSKTHMNCIPAIIVPNMAVVILYQYGRSSIKI